MPCDMLCDAMRGDFAGPGDGWGLLFLTGSSLVVVYEAKRMSKCRGKRPEFLSFRVPVQVP